MRAVTGSLDAARWQVFENYLQFLSNFRGRLIEEPDRVAVQSDRAAYTMLVPIAADACGAIDAFAGSVLLLPGLREVEHALARSTRQQSTDLVFMSKPVPPGGTRLPPRIRRARSPADIDAFSLTQSQGFIDDPVELADWHPWLRDANQRQRTSDRCRFLLADMDGAPSAVTLVFETADVCGIYAVATRPACRNRGLGTRLLTASEAIARRRGCQETHLQVFADTDAHGFYENRGFRETFRVGVWRATT